MSHCRLTHKSAKAGRYASEEENGEDICQISILVSNGNPFQNGGSLQFSRNTGEAPFLEWSGRCGDS